MVRNNPRISIRRGKLPTRIAVAPRSSPRKCRKAIRLCLSTLLKAASKKEFVDAVREAAVPYTSTLPYCVAGRIEFEVSAIGDNNAEDDR